MKIPVKHDEWERSVPVSHATACKCNNCLAIAVADQEQKWGEEHTANQE